LSTSLAILLSLAVIVVTVGNVPHDMDYRKAIRSCGDRHFSRRALASGHHPRVSASVALQKQT
jgi:hypothetical protein